ncbi:11016_t:CDS:1, partial [Dentiscutata erythropus]
SRLFFTETKPLLTVVRQQKLLCPDFLTAQPAPYTEPVYLDAGE